MNNGVGHVGRAVSFVLLSMFIVASAAMRYALDTTCEKPVSLGGKGFCGPSQCANIKTSDSGCMFPAKSVDYAASVSKMTCRSCTQVQELMCLYAFMHIGMPLCPLY